MEFKAFELLALSGVIYGKCDEQITQFDACLRKNGVSNPKCENEINSLNKCIRAHFKIEPICMRAFNLTRDCLFKSDGALIPCFKWKKEFETCMGDQKSYIDFLKASTEFQKQPIEFDFDRYPGTLTSNT